MTIPTGSATASLEVIGGKFAKLQSLRNKTTETHQLVVKYSQGNEPKLTVYKVKRSQNIVLIAFCFEVRGCLYYPAVEQHSERVKILGPIKKQFEDIHEKFLFKWETNKEYGSLRSVAEPSQYLSVKNMVISVSAMPDPSFRINLITQNYLMAPSSTYPITLELHFNRDWTSVAYLDHSTFDDDHDDSDMKKDRKIPAILDPCPCTK